MQNLKKVLILLSVIMIVLVGTWFILKKFYLFELVHSSIEERIGDQIENDFKFTLENFKINWLSQKIKFSGFNLVLLHQSDTVGYYRGDIQIQVQSWINLFFEPHKRITKIALSNGDLYYASDYPLIMKEKQNSEGPKIDVASTDARGKLLFADKHKERIGRLTTEFDLSVDLNYKNTEKISASHLMERITTLNLNQFHYYFKDGFYQLMVEEVALRDYTKLGLINIIINPVDSRKTFAKKKKFATGFTSVAIDSVQLIDLDRQHTNKFYVDQIQVYHPRIDVFKDRNFPDNQEFKAVLTDLLRDMETPVYIREMGFSNMFIKYSELANGADSPGELFFSEANARIFNITNVKDSVLISDKMVIEADTKFYGSGKLKASFEYTLLSKSGQFNISGSLSPFEIVKVNAIVSKLVPVNIRSGQLDKLRFNFWGTSTHANGEMWLEYSDLKLDVLEVKHWNNNFTKNLVSLIGNKLIVNSNPNKMGLFRVGEINQARDTTRPVFHFWWISLRSGLLSTIGMTSEKRKINFASGEKATFRDKIGLGKK